MIPVLTASQMREVDRHAIEDVGIPGRVLMEHAGRALAEHARRMCPGATPIAVLCGPGNNGGDGFVAARFLAHWGAPTRVFVACDPDRIRGHAAEAHDSAVRAGVSIETLADGADLTARLSAHGLLVDCLLGTGSGGTPRQPMASVVDAMNRRGADILSCDLPTGVDADTGAVPGVAIRATRTLAIGYPKVGLLLHPGAGQAGELHTADIGFPRGHAPSLPPEAFLVEAADAASRVPSRAADGHKGTCGRVLVVAGCVGVTGAAGLAAEAVLRAGAGLVTVATAASAQPTVAAAVPEATTTGLSEAPGGTVSAQAEGSVRGIAGGCQAIAIGPGLGQSDGATQLVRGLLDDPGSLPPGIVVDADALNVVSPLRHTGVRFPPGSVLTPHPGEMARLLGSTVADVQQRRIGAARDLAMDQAVTVVLKGAPTVIAAPDGTVYLNPTGNPGMATGGSGDVLTGVLAGLLAQGVRPTDAAILGVYTHGLAGDLAAAELGRAMLAGDILRAIPHALTQLERA